MLEIEVSPTKEDVVAKSRLSLEKFLNNRKDENIPVLLCLSGGSALSILDSFNFDVLDDNVTIVVLDERFSSDPAVNNLAQIERTGFLDEVKKKGCKVIDTKVSGGETLEELVTRFNLALETWIKDNKNGEIVATAGMGPDGHTSGIIPESDNFKELFMTHSEKFVVGYRAANQPEDRNQRVTTNFDFLRKIAFAVLVVMGEEKLSAMRRLVATSGSLEETPARIWREVVGVVELHTNLNIS